jgi:ABC-2 type transport system ATP-binding protein
VIIINHGKIVTDKKLDKLISEEQEQVIEVEFDKAVSTELLAMLPNFKSATNTHDLIWELTFISAEDMRSKLFDFANENCLKTLQLNLKSKNLEQIFREKTK